MKTYIIIYFIIFMTIKIVFSHTNISSQGCCPSQITGVKNYTFKIDNEDDLINLRRLSTISHEKLSKLGKLLSKRKNSLTQEEIDKLTNLANEIGVSKSDLYSLENKFRFTKTIFSFSEKTIVKTVAYFRYKDIVKQKNANNCGPSSGANSVSESEKISEKDIITIIEKNRTRLAKKLLNKVLRKLNDKKKIESVKKILPDEYSSKDLIKDLDRFFNENEIKELFNNFSKKRFEESLINAFENCEIKISAEPVTLKELRDALRALGYKADGVKFTIFDLRVMGKCIINIRYGNMDHFTVSQKIYSDDVYIKDSF